MSRAPAAQESATRQRGQHRGERDDRRGTAHEPVAQRGLRAVDARPCVVLADAERVGHLGVREAVDLVEQEGGALRRGQRRQRAVQLRERRRVRDFLRRVGRRHGLEPESLRERALRTPTRAGVGAHVRQDATEPRAEAVLTAEAVHVPDGALVRLLQRVLGLGAAAETSLRLREQHVVVVAHEVGEGVVVALEVGLDERAVTVEDRELDLAGLDDHWGPCSWLRAGWATTRSRQTVKSEVERITRSGPPWGDSGPAGVGGGRRGRADAETGLG